MKILGKHINDPVSAIVQAIAWVAAILITISIAIILFGPLIDYSGTPSNESVGTVTDKNHQDAWVQIIPIYNPATKVTTNTIINHPEQWVVTVTIQEGSDDLAIDQTIYDTIEIGDEVTVSWTQGRLTKSLEFTSLVRED